MGRLPALSLLAGLCLPFAAAGCTSFEFDEAHVQSMMMDVLAWSASNCGDCDDDGIAEIALLSAAVDSDGERLAWILAGDSLEPRIAFAAGPGTALSVGAALDREHAHRVGWIVERVDPLDPGSAQTSEERWLVQADRGASVQVRRLDAAAEGFSTAIQDGATLNLGLLEPGSASWAQSWTHPIGQEPGFDYPGSEQDRSVVLEKVGAPASAVPCGDLDADGAIDWLVVPATGRRWSIVSPRTGSVLRAGEPGPDEFATIAAGWFDLGDVDADGVADRALGVQVSTSADRTGPRTLHVGLLSVVSSADGRALASIEHGAFAAGAGARCQLVRLAD